MKWGLLLSVTSCGVKLRSVPDVIDIELYMGVRRYFSLKVQLPNYWRLSAANEWVNTRREIPYLLAYVLML